MYNKKKNYAYIFLESKIINHLNIGLDYLSSTRKLQSTSHLNTLYCGYTVYFIENSPTCISGSPGIYTKVSFESFCHIRLNLFTKCCPNLAKGTSDNSDISCKRVKEQNASVIYTDPNAIACLA